MTTRIARPALAVLISAILALTAACSSSEPVLTIADPYAKAMPAGEMTAAFATVTNTTGADIEIVEARSDAADMVELHEMTMDGSTMAMSAVDKIVVPADGSVTLEPGGLHVMLMGLVDDLNPGDDVTITLVLSTGDEITFTAVVRDMPNAQESYHS